MKVDSARTVAIVTPYFPPHGGGLEKYACEEARRLSKEFGWRVIVVTTSSKGSGDVHEQIDGIDIFRLGYSFRFSNTPVSFSWYRKIRRIFAEYDPAIVHIHTPVPGIGNVAAFAAGKDRRVVVTYHTASMRKGVFMMDVFVWLYETFALPLLLKRANTIVAASDYVRNGFLKRYRHKSVTITPGTDTSLFSPDFSKRVDGRVLFVAGLSHAESYKGLKNLIDAMVCVKKKLPHVSLSIVGCGSKRAQYESYVKESGLSDSVVFTGRLEGEALVREFQKASLFVLPTASDNFPTVIVEAMSSALPVISTRVGGIPSLIRDGETGYMIDPSDVRALSVKIEQLLTDTQRARAFGEAARAIAVEQYDWSARAIMYERLFGASLALEHSADPKNRRTVAIVTPYFPPHGGGLERYAREVAGRLTKQHNWRVIVITSGQYRGDDSVEESGLYKVYRLGFGLKFSNTPFSFGWRSKIRQIFEAEKPDVINIHMPVPGIGDVALLCARKLPVVVTYHTVSMRKHIFIPDIFVWIYEHVVLPFVLMRADRIICSSDVVRHTFLKSYLYKSETISPAVDSEFFFPDQAKRSDEPSVLFVAGLNKSEQFKGLKTLLDALVVVKKEIPSVQLTVVGQGDMMEEYVKYVASLGLTGHVNFRGRLAGRELVSTYQETHVFASPSTNESFGIVNIEAMASGVPVVAVAVGGVPLVIDNNQTGLLVPPRDSRALAKGIIEVLSNKDLALRFAQKGRAKAVEKYAWNERMIRYHHVLTDVVQDSPERKPSLIVVAPYFYPKIGGLENYAYNIAKRFQRSGRYRVSVITSNHEGRHYKQDVIDDVVIHRLPIWFKISNTPVNPLWYWWIRRIYSLERPVLINTHSPVPFLADLAVSAAGRTPVVVTYHAGSMLKGRWAIDLILRLYENVSLYRLFRRANAIVPISQSFARSRFPQFVQKMIFIPTGVDLNRFMVTPLPHSGVVTYVGRIERSSSWKGIEQLLQAMVLVRKECPHARLSLVGGGDALEDYKKRAVELGIDDVVTLRGPLMHEELVSAFRQTDMVVLPSTSDAEAFSVALVEAMASGRPVIGTNIGGTPQVISHEKDGLLVEPKNPAALAEAIVRILKDRAFAERLAQAGATKAQSYSWDSQIEKYRRLFDAVRNGESITHL